MKLDEMADLLDGLATTLERLLGKATLNDMRAVADCFRKFPGENVSTFCTHVVQAREGKVTAGKAKATTDEGRVEDFVARIRHYLENRQSYDYAAIRQIVAHVGKLKVAEIKAIGERIECPLTERTKAGMLTSLESWLSNIKLSADQSSFSLSGAAVP